MPSKWKPLGRLVIRRGANSRAWPSASAIVRMATIFGKDNIGGIGSEYDEHGVPVLALHYQATVGSIFIMTVDQYLLHALTPIVVPTWSILRRSEDVARKRVLAKRRLYFLPQPPVSDEPLIRPASSGGPGLRRRTENSDDVPGPSCSAPSDHLTTSTTAAAVRHCSRKFCIVCTPPDAGCPPVTREAAADVGRCIACIPKMARHASDAAVSTKSVARMLRANHDSSVARLRLSSPEMLTPPRPWPEHASRQA
ncbi:hypothetical protein RJ55_02932 [Drechmeria coniospora]|nr:hypothetical protein RJ55_02932 [Drechmeria coniospora]